MLQARANRSKYKLNAPSSTESSKHELNAPRGSESSKYKPKRSKYKLKALYTG